RWLATQLKPLLVHRCDDNPPDDVSLSGEEGGTTDQEDSAEGEGSSPLLVPLYNEEPRTHEPPGTPDTGEEDEKGQRTGDEEEERMEEEDNEDEEEANWNGPDDLELVEGLEDSKVLARRDLSLATAWGPFPGTIQSNKNADGTSTEGTPLALVCEDVDYWITKVPVTSCYSEANCTISCQGDGLLCKLNQDLRRGDALVATLSRPATGRPSTTQTHNAPVKEEPTYAAAPPSEIQLLPQQAGMAAILATAVINKDVFPCKDCGIWYRSERNLQAHLMYYCASRQKQKTTASPPQDKPKDTYPNERVCPFPQCNKTCPSASSLEIHMRTHSGERPFVCLICLSAFTTKANCERHLKVHTDTLNGVCHGCGFVSTTRDILYSHLVTSHMVCQPGSRSEVYSPKVALASAGLSPGDSGVVLKCQVCGFAADTPALLQQHVHTHLELRVPAERSPAPQRSSTPASELPEAPDGERTASVPRPSSSSPEARAGSAASRGRSPPEPLSIKEEPRSDSEGDARDVAREGDRHRKHAKGGSPHPASPKSPPAVAVKTEPTSPTPGCSPVHPGAGAPVPAGAAVFLPQYLFSSEAAIMPQASEILAKMSEMVHSRLKQGQGPASTQQGFYPTGSPAGVPKGATCFECDITFNNINNYYAHKRLYCSSRHQQGEGAGPAKDSPVPTAPPGGPDASPQAGPGSRAASASPGHSDPAAAGSATDAKPAEVKSETPGPKDAACSSSSEGEGGGGGRASEGSQSPGGSAEDPEEDPTRTYCQACNIRFSRHENYTVHKRFYCASRHDPSNQRLLPGKATFLPQPVRTRKRKKMYEIHMARSEALANATALSTTPGMAVKQEGNGSPSRSASASTAARCSSPESDGPIDLSKKPRLRETTRGSGISALPLTDYHKCTACSISFNSIENYLAHKTYYCPATTLQPHTLEQLQRLKRPVSTSPKSRGPDLHPDAKGHQTGKSTAVPASLALPGPDAVPVTKAPGTPPVVCPYCPPNRAVTSDLMEHFRTAHGLVLSLQPEAGPAHVSPGPALSPGDGAPPTPPKPGPKPQRDSVNGRGRRDAASPSSPLLNGSTVGHPPAGGGSPKAARPALSPTGSIPLTVSPVPEALREVGSRGHTPTPLLLPEKALNHAHVAPAVPLQNGNTRYCRLCNIKFSSLSTFIAHKKYYCSSHSAEHVK
uniref:Zinc finger protein, FOG family member 1 n=1 Tax=Electrophorus electricus TaxID=8005 RepID=A0A4W4F953_ELEEL